LDRSFGLSLILYLSITPNAQISRKRNYLRSEAGPAHQYQ